MNCIACLILSCYREGYTYASWHTRVPRPSWPIVAGGWRKFVVAAVPLCIEAVFEAELVVFYHVVYEMVLFSPWVLMLLLPNLGIVSSTQH